MNEGIALYKKGLYKEALQELLSADADPGEYPELAYYLGLCYTKLEKYDEALLYLEQVVTSNLGESIAAQARLILGYIYSITGRHRLAEYELKELIKAGYRTVQVYAALGHIAFLQGMERQSVEYLKEAVKLDPDNATALNNLGYVLAEMEDELDQAISMCKKAHDMKPDNPAYLDSLGWVCYKKGRKAEARSYLRRALSLLPDNHIIRSHLKELRGDVVV